MRFRYRTSLLIYALTQQFTACGPFAARLIISKPSSLTTIHSIRLSIIQHETITSPRDGTVRILKPRLTPFGVLGSVPPKSNRYPDHTVPALWRGKGVTGVDVDSYKGEMRGRFPHGSYARYSTLPGSVKISYKVDKMC
jgi:hypothetical protein